MKKTMKFALASAGLAVGIVASLSLFIPAPAVAEPDAADEDGIVMGLGYVTDAPGGGKECTVESWVEHGDEVTPVPGAKVLIEAVD